MGGGEGCECEGQWWPHPERGGRKDGYSDTVKESSADGDSPARRGSGVSPAGNSWGAHGNHLLHHNGIHNVHVHLFDKRLFMNMSNHII